jgi:hypothetical protein
LAKNRTQVMRVLSQKVMKWQPYLSRSKPHQVILPQALKAYMPHGKGR